MSGIVLIPSMGRPQNVARMMGFAADLPTVWCVPPDEQDAYRAEGAETIPDTVTKNVSAARNQLHDEAIRRDATWAVMADDDLQSLTLVQGPKRYRSITFPAFAEIAERVSAEFGGVGLVGPNYTQNAYFAAQTVAPLGQFDGQLMWLSGDGLRNLRWDETLRISEDMEIICQAMVRYGAAPRVNFVVKQGDYYAPGGIQSYLDRDERDNVIDAEAIRVISARYPALVRPHPTRHGLQFHYRPGRR